MEELLSDADSKGSWEANGVVKQDHDLDLQCPGPSQASLLSTSLPYNSGLYFSNDACESLLQCLTPEVRG